MRDRAIADFDGVVVLAEQGEHLAVRGKCFHRQAIVGRIRHGAQDVIRFVGRCVSRRRRKNQKVIGRGECISSEQRRGEQGLGIVTDRVVGEAVAVEVLDLTEKVNKEVDGCGSAICVFYTPDRLQLDHAAVFIARQLHRRQRLRGVENGVGRLDAPAAEGVEIVLGLSGRICLRHHAQRIRRTERIDRIRRDRYLFGKRRHAADLAVGDNALRVGGNRTADSFQTVGERICMVADGIDLFAGDRFARSDLDGMRDVPELDEKLAAFQLLHIARRDLAAIGEVGVAPGVVVEHRQLDAERRSVQYVIDLALRRGIGRRGNVHGVERVVADERRIGVGGTAFKVAAVVPRVVGQIVDIACCGAAERNAPFLRSVRVFGRIRRRVRPDKRCVVQISMREEAFSLIAVRLETKIAVHGFQLLRRDVIASVLPLERSGLLQNRIQRAVEINVVPQRHLLGRVGVRAVFRLLVLRIFRVFGVLRVFGIFGVFRAGVFRIRIVRIFILCRVFGAGIVRRVFVRRCVRGRVVGSLIAGQDPCAVAQRGVHMVRVRIRAGERLRVHRDLNGLETFPRVLVFDHFRKRAGKRSVRGVAILVVPVQNDLFFAADEHRLGRLLLRLAAGQNRLPRVAIVRVGMLLSFFQTADQLASFLRIARICVDMRFGVVVAGLGMYMRRKLRQRTCKHAVFVIAARIVPVHDNKPALR